MGARRDSPAQAVLGYSHRAASKREHQALSLREQTVTEAEPGEARDRERMIYYRRGGRNSWEWCSP